MMCNFAIHWETSLGERHVDSLLVTKFRVRSFSFLQSEIYWTEENFYFVRLLNIRKIFWKLRYLIKFLWKLSRFQVERSVYRYLHIKNHSYSLDPKTSRLSKQLQNLPFLISTKFTFKSASFDQLTLTCSQLN